MSSNDPKETTDAKDPSEPQPESDPQPELNSTAAYKPVTEAPGSQIGRYKLLQKIGEGGFGVVYMAEQQRPVRRKVALKIIKPGMDTHAVVARFEAERQALALMDHPNIARVLDGGTTDSGRPYFVMELVKGVTITEFCDKNKLGTEERLGLFIKVCQAVQHAHQKGIIHRDLKPSNTLITLHDGEPAAKVIDFGIAKAVNQQLTEKTLFTAYGQMIGTPQYMSPEQAEMSGLDIDTRSDIYSLGVMLYELLTGTTPLESERLRDAGYAKLQQMIREEEPSKPSTRLSTSGEKLTGIAKHRSVSPEVLQRLVKGDLDWIVMKSLEKERSRRYASANEFADDVLHFLNSEPVMACPPSKRYRMRKFIRRNRGPVTAAIVIVGVLVAAIVGTTLFALETRRYAKETLVLTDQNRSREFIQPLGDLRETSLLMVMAPNRELQVELNKEQSSLTADLDALFSDWEKLPGDASERRAFDRFRSQWENYRKLKDVTVSRALDMYREKAFINAVQAESDAFDALNREFYAWQQERLRSLRSETSGLSTQSSASSVETAETAEIGTTPGVAEPFHIQEVTFREDDAQTRFVDPRMSGSHVKVFLPSLPHIYISHAINGALVRPSQNARGWVYDMAVSHRQINDTTYEFKLRQGVKFQDGTPFNADSVVMNMVAFREQPSLFSKIDYQLRGCEKIDDYTVRFDLREKYGCFMNDLIWMPFYTKKYLDINGWNGKATCPNLSTPGPYGLGPYILTEGYIEGDRHTPKAVLKANPNYWDKNYPKVETITVFTELDSTLAKHEVLESEGELDIAFIAPEYKVDTIRSPYAKLVTSPSTNGIAIHMNLINGNPKLQDRSVRRALNEAIHQRYLSEFVFDREALLSPTQASPLFPGMQKVNKLLKPYSDLEDPFSRNKRRALKNTLEGLHLKVLTQTRFLGLWRSIETHLEHVGVTLDIIEVKSEKYIFGPLLVTNAGKNDTDWDLLVYGNDDWFFNHPFSAFRVYRTHNVWSTIFPDPVLDGYIEEMFQANVEDPEFEEITYKIVKHVYDNAYMMFVPTPNNVFAVNKEVGFEPYRMACMPLWKIQITDQHWSVREGPYDESQKQPVEITRFHFP